MNNNDALTRGIWIDNDGSPNGTATSGYATETEESNPDKCGEPFQTVTVANDGRCTSLCSCTRIFHMGVAV